MLRTIALLLLLANLAFFAWVRGWLAPGLAPPRHGEREPERLAAQISPQLVVVLPAKDAGAAVVAARAAAAVCLEAGPLGESDIVAAEGLVATAQLPQGAWVREPAATPPLWLVYAGRWPEPGARRTREAELRKLGLNVETLTAPADLAPGLVLSRHASKAEAEAALATLASTQAALKGLRVANLPAPPPAHWLRVARADGDIQARLQLLPGSALAGGFKPCAPARP